MGFFIRGPGADPEGPADPPNFVAQIFPSAGAPLRDVGKILLVEIAETKVSLHAWDLGL